MSRKPSRVALATPVSEAAALSIGNLEVVLAVANTGSMSGAAQRLKRSQSAVSQVVAQIEASLGYPLFDRTRRPFRATTQGSELTRHASRILRDIQALPQHLAALNDRPTLRIALVDSFANTLGPDLVQFAAQRSGDLFVSQGLTPAHLNDLLERRVDLIVSADALEEYDALARFPILTEKLVVLLPGGTGWNPARQKLAVLARELPFIRYSGRSITGAMVERYLRIAQVTTARRIEVDNADMMCTLVAHGVGWAITTPLHVLQCLERLAGVAVHRLPSPTPERQMTLITRDGEWNGMAEQLAREARRLLVDTYLPRLFAVLPHLGKEIEVAQ